MLEACDGVRYGAGRDELERAAGGAENLLGELITDLKQRGRLS